MNVSEAIEYMEDEVRCIQRATYCDRDCANCNLVKEEKPLLESFYIAIKAIEKQIPKKPTIEEFDYGEGYVCGECGLFLHYVDDDEEHIRINHCPNCGQKLDWSAKDE